MYWAIYQAWTRSQLEQCVHVKGQSADHKCHASPKIVAALPCPALRCPALPCPALPCPALPCPALPCPALPCPALSSVAVA